MKTLILFLSVIAITMSYAQDKSACGNCNEKYLQVRTFGGTNVINLNKTYYVFYKLYTPHERTCLSQYKAENKVAEAFKNALLSHAYYQELVKKYEEERNSFLNHKNNIVGNITFYTDDHDSILDPFKKRAENFNYAVKYIELDFDIEALFTEYPICD